MIKSRNSVIINIVSLSQSTMNNATDKPDDSDSLLRELIENWDEISSQMMSDQLPTTSFAMSAVDDFQALLAQSTVKLEKILRKKQKSAGGFKTQFYRCGTKSTLENLQHRLGAST